MTELETSVDQLMRIVRDKKKISVSDAAKALNLSEKTVQNWVDFLVEEHILGVEYKFTTPYIYVNSEEKLKKVSEDHKTLTLDDFKQVFITYAKQKNMPEEKIEGLWEQHLLEAVNSRKQFFMQECERRGVPHGEALFNDYTEDLIDGIN